VRAGLQNANSCRSSARLNLSKLPADQGRGTHPLPAEGEIESLQFRPLSGQAPLAAAGLQILFLLAPAALSVWF